MAALDGIGLDPRSLELLAEHGGVVHARVGAINRPRRTACEGGLGEWWTGVAGQVTCEACRVELARRA